MTRGVEGGAVLSRSAAELARSAVWGEGDPRAVAVSGELRTAPTPAGGAPAGVRAPALVRAAA